jgi:hypothetical protein
LLQPPSPPFCGMEQHTPGHHPPQQPHMHHLFFDTLLCRLSTCCPHAARLLQLPAPDADELGRPVWEVTDSEISKAYRRLSVLVHPDKNPGPEARQAFEYLNQAYRELRDPEKRVGHGGWQGVAGECGGGQGGEGLEGQEAAKVPGWGDQRQA